MDAGKGASLTARLCQTLIGRDDIMVEYVATDASLDLVKVAVKETSYKYITAKSFDLSQDPVEQGFSPSAFDIVIGFNSLHPIPDIAVTMSFLNKLLVPGGSLLLAELDGTDWSEKPGSVWIDAVFGTFPEWLCYTDDRSSTALAPEDWTSLLQKTGYQSVNTLGCEHGGLGFIIAAVTSQTCTSSFDESHRVFLPYSYGREMELQSRLSRFDVNEPLSLWLMTEDGIEGHSALGLVQSIIREFTSWDIRLAIFDTWVSRSEQISKIGQFQDKMAGDTVIRFSRDGRALIPKVVKAPAPPAVAKFDPTAAWTSTGSSVMQIHLGSPKEHESLIEVSSWSTASRSFRGFVGSILESNGVEGFSPGQRVVGVCDSPLANRILCHSGQLVPLGHMHDADLVAEYALAAVVVTLALGTTHATFGTKRPAKRLFVADEDELSQAVNKILALHPSLATVATGYPAHDAKFDRIIASSDTIISRPEVSSWSGKLCIWDSLIHEMISEDPWSLGETIHRALELTFPLSGLGTAVHPLDLVLHSLGSVAPSLLPLFDATKAYILLGGVSDLGIYVALWMYQVSSSNLILFRFPHIFLARRQKYHFDFSTWPFFL